MKVLLLERIDEAGMTILRDAGFQIDLAPELSEAGLIRIVGDYDAILVRAMIPLTAEVIRAAKRCRIISRHGVGLETIDVAAATQAGIPVAYTPGANANAVAEHTVSLMLDVLKQNCRLSRKLMQEHDYNCRFRVSNGELRGKTVGILGLGSIGSRTAQILSWGFGAEILGYSPHATQERFDKLQVKGRLATGLEDLLANSDIVSLHMPGIQPGLICERTLGLMRQGSILINTSRGVLVDEDALYRALVSGHLAGAGLDVTAKEPPEPDNPLFTLENVVITPHTGALTREALSQMAVGSAGQIADYLLHGKMPWGFANPQVWERRR